MSLLFLVALALVVVLLVRAVFKEGSRVSGGSERTVPYPMRRGLE